MESKNKVFLMAVFAFAIITAVFMLVTNDQPRFQGFAIYESGCSGSISTSGYWELNSSLNQCSNTSAITINASNVIFDCANNALLGSNGSYGIYVLDNLANITIQNCALSNFSTALFVGSLSNVTVINSTADTSVCVEGNWTDSADDKGCLDIRAPQVNITNITHYTNESVSYQITASDVSGILSYSVPHSSFSISDSGLLTNVSSLTAQNYTLNITVKDTKSQNASALMTLHVLLGTATPAAQSSSSSSSDSDDDDSEDSDDDSDEEVSTTQVSISSLAEKCSLSAWACSSWSECSNSTEVRECTKNMTSCTNPMPETSRACASACEPSWECSWSECSGNIQTASGCIDLNACNVTIGAPTQRECLVEEIESDNFFTGFLVTDLKKVTTPSNLIKLILIILAVSFVFFLVAKKIRDNIEISKIEKKVSSEEIIDKVKEPVSAKNKDKDSEFYDSSIK